ncbi:MAG: glutathione peroxidase [Gammaproteobacteria bacterium]
MKETIFEYTCKDVLGQDKSLSDLEGKVTLIVNTASNCGFTPQYEGLEDMYQKYKEKGLEILAFPCNQFGNQEPGTNEEVKEFCSLNYGVSFPIFSKIEVNGKNADPLFKFLSSSKKGLLGSGQIKWNFTKFLINKDGKPIKRFSPTTTPEKISSEIDKILS